MSPATKPFRVLIIGGGPAGLLTAQALQKRGISCTVFEKGAILDTRSRDWNFGIYWAQSPLGDCLPDDLSKLIVDKCQVDRRQPNADEVLPAFNGQSGELIKAIPTPYNIRLHRRNFVRLLSTDVEIQYGKELDRIESDGKTATAFFKDGTVETGNLLVGAEGAHSKVREFLLGDEKSKLSLAPLYANTAMAKLPREAAVAFRETHPRYIMCFHPNGDFGWFSIQDNFEGTGPGDWNFMVLQTWPSEHEHNTSNLQGSDILAAMKKRAEVYAEPFRTLFSSIPEGTKCWHNQLTYWIPRPWDNHNGTVTLVGDAAHPMTFHRGQGLNNAVHDAHSLAMCLSEQSAANSFESRSSVDAYEREMIERGQIAVQGSLDNSIAVHNWETLLQSPLFQSGMAKPSDAK